VFPGVCNRGVNGYVGGADGSKKLWVARRSASKQTWPGRLDHIVAGGQVGVLKRHYVLMVI
jgi:hypothetical protein